ncbi:MAG: transglutaminase-like domain-containing protein [Methanothrix sp.]|nr:transglutaminase-like domain-containing protein [Methanothrix sp.]
MSSVALWLCVVLFVGSAVASDVPFVFDAKNSSVANYTSDQLERASVTSSDLTGVPFTFAPLNNETLEFPVVGGGNAPTRTTEKNIEDLKKMLNSKVEADNPAVIEEVGLAAGRYSGDYTIDQVGAIYDYLKENWHYMRDPRGVDYFKNASESLNLGKRSGCVGVGDCDDFAILMSALVESIGGTTRIVLARNNSTGGHAYSEVYLGQVNVAGSQVEDIINWLEQEFETDKIYTHIDTDTKDVWLNFDWGADEKGNAHPGGPFFQGDKHYIICIRDNFGKTALKLPEKSNKPPKLISLTPDKTSPQEAGTTITWTAEAKDLDKDQISYRFFINDESATNWSKDNKWIWATTDDDAGENQVEIRIRDGKHRGPNRFDDNRIASFNVTVPNLKLTAPANQLPVINRLVPDNATILFEGASVKDGSGVLNLIIKIEQSPQGEGKSQAEKENLEMNSTINLLNEADSKGLAVSISVTGDIANKAYPLYVTMLGSKENHELMMGGFSEGEELVSFEDQDARLRKTKRFVEDDYISDGKQSKVAGYLPQPDSFNQSRH